MATDEALQNAIHAVIVEPHCANTRRWFAAGADGIIVSTDQGQTWQDALARMELDAVLTISALALSPDYCSDSTLIAGALGGILRSVDCGETWAVVTFPTPPPYIVELIFSPNFRADGLIFAATLEDGIFRSWDRGVSWASWNFGLLDLNTYCLAASPNYGKDETLYTGTESGVFYSANGGRAWRETAFSMDAAPVLSLAVTDAEDGNSILYAGTEDNRIYHSSDGGAHWEYMDLPTDAGAVNQICTGNYNGLTAVLAVTGSAVYRVDELGNASELLRLAEPQTLISAAALVDSPSSLSLLLGTTTAEIKLHNL